MNEITFDKGMIIMNLKMHKLILSLILASCIGLLPSPGASHAQVLSTGADMPAVQQSMSLAMGGSATLGSLNGSTGTVVVFWSNQCPWTAKYEGRLLSLASELSHEDISFIFMNSNDATAFPEESREVSADYAEGYSPVHYVMDTGSQIARAFGARRTPHVFVFDGGGTLVYQGAIDDSPGDPSDVQEAYLENVLTALVQGQSPSVNSTRSFGCTIKFE